MRKLLSVLALLYPIVLYGFRNRPEFYAIALGLGGVLILDLIARFQLRFRVLSVFLILGLILVMRVMGVPNEFRLYPFLMSLSMLFLFALNREPARNPMFGPFKARFLSDPPLLKAMHEAKVIWVVGLFGNTLVLFGFLFAFSDEAWATYASFYSYLVLLSLFCGSVIYVHLRKRSVA